MNKTEHWEKRVKNRLSNYNYAENNAYYLTLCTHEKKKILWENDILTKDLCLEDLESKAYLSEKGLIVDETLKNIENFYKNVLLHHYCIMPNHVHFILVLNFEEMDKKVSVSEIVRQFKGIVSKKTGSAFWQKSFYDHVIRNEEDYLRIRQYITENPIKWKDDEYS